MKHDLGNDLLEISVSATSMREESNVFFLVCHLSASAVAQSNFVLFSRPRRPRMDFCFCQQDGTPERNLDALSW